MITLYNSAFSTCSQKVRLCLAEKNLAWTDHQVDLGAGEHLGDAYLKINPNGVVPALDHDGKVVIESHVICEYLDEVFPNEGHRLVPQDTHARAQMRSWLYYVSEVPTSAIRYPSFNRLFRDAISKANTPELRERMPLRKSLYRKFGTSGFSEVEIRESRDALRQTVDRIDAASADSAWIMGEQFTLADICVTPTIVRMQDIHMSDVWDGLLNFQAWFERIQARPSFAKAFYEGSRLIAPIGRDATADETRDMLKLKAAR
jgi:glutathione S-transferase